MTEAEVKVLAKAWKKYAKENNPSQLESDIARWLITHGQIIIEDIQSTHNSAYHLFPDNVIDIYLDNYANNMLSAIRTRIENNNNYINPEEIHLIITKDWLSMLFGDKIFLPPIKRS